MKFNKFRKEDGRLLESLIASLRERKPILKDPGGLTDDIMNAISKTAKVTSHQSKKSSEIPVIIIIRRLLAAASVCLFLVFGYEEYVVVDKISRLEEQCSAISQSSQYQAALNLKSAMTMLSVNPGLINHYIGTNLNRINLRTIFKAAMFADAGRLSPDSFKYLNRAGFNLPDQAIISLFNQFDSTHNNF